MAKNKKRNRKGKPAAPTGPASVELSPKPQDAVTVSKIIAASVEATTAAGAAQPKLPDEPVPPNIDLEDMWKIVREAREAFSTAERRQIEATQRVEDTLQRTATLDVRAAELDEREAGLRSRSEALDRRESEITGQDAALVEREAKLRGRELNAEANFGRERRAMLSGLEDEREELRLSLRELEQEIADQRRAWHQQERTSREAHRAELAHERETLRANLDQIKAAGEARLVERERALDQREDALQSEQRRLSTQKQRLGFEAEELDERRGNLDTRVALRCAALKEALEHQLRAREQELVVARRDRDVHLETLLRREEVDRRFGQRTPEQIIAELDRLRTENQELAASLAERPDAATTAQLHATAGELHNSQIERGELHRQVSELRRRLAAINVDVGEREVQRDVIQTLESQRSLLAEAHQQLRVEVDDLLSRSATTSPFPACAAMDADPKLQSPTPLFKPVTDLEEFVEDLRHRIAIDPAHPERRLFYSLADLRNFLAGVAMSRLLLLQGISGTGKTSLPLAFARAVGSEATVIEVQAGWRDPQDLVGHYNVFEKRFYETEFLKALYLSRTPRQADAIHIVVLDEMNLSHPEQYFSGLLSALERKPEERLLGLMSHALDRAPALFSEGSKLLIPTNIWFVGTANHDETTKDFADKTYDRAHVMELPHRPEEFAVNALDNRPPVSFTALESAFEAAVSRHTSDAKRAVDFLNQELHEMLARDFEIGWGPRLERQMYRYLPVVRAAGGSIGEATDHMLATRLLRKLKSRHDSRPEQLQALRTRIEESWPALDAKHGPERSLEALDRELRRKGLDGEVSA